VLACGPDAVLSHQSAALLWGMRVPEPARTVIDCADLLTYAELRTLAGYESDIALVAGGWRVARLSYDQVVREPSVAAARLRAILARHPGVR
jgi:hypothetical protein